MKKAVNKQFKKQNEWIKENRERITIALPIGTKERIKNSGAKSFSDYIVNLVLNDLDSKENNG